MSAEFRPEQLHTLLPLYYKRLFPYEQHFRWLNYNSDHNRLFRHREFSFELQGEIYLRYQSFDNQFEFMKSVQKKVPEKIDIGAIYNVEPVRRPAVGFAPKEREIVFDIDMSDYDDVRTCCSKTDICNKCWKFMVVACKILDVALKQDFGFYRLLWVFSGRRGIHCWVSDDNARILDDSGRGAVAEYLSLVSGGSENVSRKVYLPGDKLHNHVKRSMKIIEEYFVPICIIEQDMLGTNERLEKFFSILREHKGHFAAGMSKLETSEDRWNYFAQEFDELFKKGALNKSARFLKEEIQLQYLYPRLDINVTKGLNHLLKSPFCVHPKSGKVSIPFSAKAVEKFDPLTVPTISLLVNEINAYDEKTKELENALENNQDSEKAVETENEDTNNKMHRKQYVKDYKKTSLSKPVTIFEEFLSGFQNSSSVKTEKNTSFNGDVSMEF